jgi:glycosyltransferase involved in cell wall biosynthesis
MLAFDPRPSVTQHRFAIVSPNFFPRTCGVGDYSARLGQKLRRLGFTVSVFSRDPVQPNPIEPELPVLGAAGTEPDVIAKRLSEAILETRPTEVILQYTPQMWNAWRFGSAALPRLAAAMQRAGARVTLIAHELYISFARRPDLMLASVTQRAQLAYLLAHCDRSFVTTESRLKFIEPFCRLLGRPAPGVLRVGPNALPVPRRERGSGARVGVFSTAAVGKRFDIVLDAFTRVWREFPAAELLIIGDLGSPDARHVRQVIDAVRHHEASNKIRLTGKLPLDDIAREIADLDLYLFPVDTGANTRSGTLPVALGTGLPVVAFDGPETDHSFFRSGENIVLVPELTASAFSDATLRLLRNPSQAAQVGSGARVQYERHLTWDRITEHLLNELGMIAPEGVSVEPSSGQGHGTA